MTKEKNTESEIKTNYKLAFSIAKVTNKGKKQMIVMLVRNINSRYCWWQESYV
jgi:hypothetical protein